MILCAKLFPSHAPIAHRAVARLAALGWTEGQIATYLRKASKDPSLRTSSTRHPLLTAVWLAEREFREAPRPPTLESPTPDETPPPRAQETAQHADAPPAPPGLRSKIDEARAAWAAAERKVGLKRRRTPNDPPEGEGGGS